MNSPGLDCDLPDSARRLAATDGGTSAGLRRERSHAQIETHGTSFCRRQVPAGNYERVELLGAVAQATRHRVARSSRQDISCLEGTEVHTRLLRHLAHPPRYIQLQKASIALSVTEPETASCHYNSLARAV